MWALLTDPFFVRNLVYGVEDSLVSTAGAAAGVTFAGLPAAAVVVAALVLVFVEAASMAFGAFVAEESFLRASGRWARTGRVLLYAGTMFAAYAATGLLVLLPYLLRARRPHLLSLGLAVAGLFALVAAVERSWARAAALTAVGVAILLATAAVGSALQRAGLAHA